MIKNQEKYDAEKEIEILCKSYSKEELAELLLYAVDVIQEKNKLLEQKNG